MIRAIELCISIVTCFHLSIFSLRNIANSSSIAHSNVRIMAQKESHFLL